MKKVVRVVSLMILMVGAGGNAFAGTNETVVKQGTIRGRVIDNGKQILPGASIFIENLKTGVISDVNGFYTLPNLKPGTYTVKVTYVGYSPIEMKITVPEGKTLEKELNFYMANDLGRNGFYDQKPIAAVMGEMADAIGPECVFAAGDVHHFEGVRSVDDPLWMTNYELIYSHPELMIDWFPVLGNHEYRGNTQAVLDYTRVSRRWSMPARYYTKTFEKKGTAIRFAMIDTAPLIDKYRRESETYPEVCQQDMNRQLAWIDSVLTVAKEDWVVVMGHHPIYAETPKDASERTDMQARLDPILRKHKVDIYACGHIHNFQHIRVAGSFCFPFALSF